jgi:hypothetical protein
MVYGLTWAQEAAASTKQGMKDAGGLMKNATKSMATAVQTGAQRAADRAASVALKAKGSAVMKSAEFTLRNAAVAYRLPNDPGSKLDVLARSRIFVVRSYGKLAMWLILSAIIVLCIAYAIMKLINIMFFRTPAVDTSSLNTDDVDNPADDDYAKSIIKQTEGRKAPTGHAIAYNIRRAGALGNRDAREALDSRKDSEPKKKREE